MKGVYAIGFIGAGCIGYLIYRKATYFSKLIILKDKFYVNKHYFIKFHPDCPKTFLTFKEHYVKDENDQQYIIKSKHVKLMKKNYRYCIMGYGFNIPSLGLYPWIQTVNFANY